MEIGELLRPQVSSPFENVNMIGRCKIGDPLEYAIIKMRGDHNLLDMVPGHGGLEFFNATDNLVAVDGPAMEIRVVIKQCHDHLMRCLFVRILVLRPEKQRATVACAIDEARDPFYSFNGLVTQDSREHILDYSGQKSQPHEPKQ
jgi:hypothetical protein